jgi:hypothetical protein
MPTMNITSDLDCQHATTQKASDSIMVKGEEGLAPRVTRAGYRSWTLRYRRKSYGKQQRMSLGAYPDTTLKVARRKARALRVCVDNDEDSAGDRREADDFAMLAKNWLEAKED